MLRENVLPVTCYATRLRFGRRQSRWRDRWALGVHVLFHGISVYTQLPGDPTHGQSLRFAFCTAFHLAVCSGVGFLRRSVAVLRTLPAPSRPEVGDGMLGIVVGVQSRQFGRPFSAQTVGGLIDNG